MSTSEFRYNKKRKHYAYLFKALGFYRKNILFSTKQTRIWKKKIKRNLKLHRHPNPNSSKVVYLIPIVYIDHIDDFYPVKLKWCFDKNDKRVIKRIKCKKRKRAK